MLDPVRDAGRHHALGAVDVDVEASQSIGLGLAGAGDGGEMDDVAGAAHRLHQRVFVEDAADLELEVTDLFERVEELGRAVELLAQSEAPHPVSAHEQRARDDAPDGPAGAGDKYEIARQIRSCRPR